MSALNLPASPKLAAIAAAAGVSLPTVSRALSGRGRVKEATRTRIVELARQIGYVPRAASAMPTLAVVVFDSDTAITERRLGHGYGSFDQRVLSGIGELARDAKARFMLAHTAGRSVEELPPALGSGAADGALLLGGMFPEPFVNLVAARTPVVLAGSFVPGGSINCVHPDYYTGAVLAVDHLAKLGHRTIAFLNGPAGTRSSAEKEAGYTDALARAGLPVDPALTSRATDFSVDEGMRACAQLLQRAAFTALITADDTFAFGAVRLLRDRGLRVPGQVSVVGFYDGPLAPVCDPPLTTVNIHHKAIGAAAARRLLDMLNDPDSPAHRIVIAPHLVVRGSTSAP